MRVRKRSSSYRFHLIPPLSETRRQSGSCCYRSPTRLRRSYFQGGGAVSLGQHAASASRQAGRVLPIGFALITIKPVHAERMNSGERAVLNGKNVFVVMPAYNAARTLAQTCAELPREIVDQVLVVDDHSSDTTVSWRGSCTSPPSSTIKPGVWPEPKDLLSRSLAPGRRYRRDAASGLSVFPPPRRGDGKHDRL